MYSSRILIYLKSLRDLTSVLDLLIFLEVLLTSYVNFSQNWITIDVHTRWILIVLRSGNKLGKRRRIKYIYINDMRRWNMRGRLFILNPFDIHLLYLSYYAQLNYYKNITATCSCTQIPLWPVSTNGWSSVGSGNWGRLMIDA